MPALPIDTRPDRHHRLARSGERGRRPPQASPSSTSSEIERLDEPLLGRLLRLTPSAAVTSIGPAGSLTEVRIRGAEANHTLLFVDGIKINDPASGDTPRFEMLNADLASRIEVVRGPQSALWGSDAIGGVIAVNGLDDAPGYARTAEGGIVRLCARERARLARERSDASLAGAVGWQRATGIDSFGGPAATRTAIATCRAGCAGRWRRARRSSSAPRRSR